MFSVSYFGFILTPSFRRRLVRKETVITENDDRFSIRPRGSFYEVEFSFSTTGTTQNEISLSNLLGAGIALG